MDQPKDADATHVKASQDDDLPTFIDIPLVLATGLDEVQ
jgi:hypothetical protein